MLWRITSFLFCQVAGGIAGWFFAGHGGAEAGIIVGGMAWFVVDLARGARVLRWLRRGTRTPEPVSTGVWGEVAERMRRAVRTREQAAADAERRLQDFLAAIQASPNGVVLLDSGGRIEWANQTAASHLGIDPQRDQLQLVGNLVRDPVFAAYFAGNDFTREITVTGRDATSSRPVRVSVHIHPYGEGRKLLLSRDITAVEQAEVMRRDFVANVSHEIRTPLTVLAGFIETLSSLELAGEERARYLDLMGQQAQRMQSLVNDLLTLSRLEGSPPPGASEWTPLQAMATQCEQEAAGLARLLGRSHRMTFEVPARVEVSGAQSELLSAFSNLVSNAVRYTPNGGRITVRWRLEPSGALEFSVQDTGPGIAPEHIPRLTERFYRVDRSRSRETGGTGLGLAIVKHVVQRHGGELRIESVPGTGSTFSVLLPSSRVRAAVSPGTTERPATESLPG